ncbi:MAG: hypothetical protein JSC188_000528 [Candidatus Tokpelaia sp. JSC188]|nr:MAG: hypothetical protein JSC188_000528 [Candidatus Tokpelaia sp. JSC188]
MEIDKKNRVNRGFLPLSEMISQVVDPTLLKRAGFNIQLLENWPEIVGSDIAETTRPLRIIWPHRMIGEDTFKAATLMVACEAFSAIRLQHESTEVIQRINTFFGFSAVMRLKIKQKSIRSTKRPLRQAVPIDMEQKKYLEQIVANIKYQPLRLALFDLGKEILSDKNRNQSRKDKIKDI